jgi:uncharacterized UBP type Zn finger protein
MPGGPYEEKVKQLMEMGYPRERVLEGLRQSGGNVDGAMEYLLMVSSSRHD